MRNSVIMSAEPTLAPLAPAPAAGKAPLRLPTGFSRNQSGRNPRAEHRNAQRLRSDEAASMADKYPQLKSLKGSLEFVDREGMTKTTAIKYSANPQHAKSVLVFACPIAECVGGDFDVTAKLADAVAARKTRLAGEIHCLGSHKKASGVVAPCRSVLRFNLTLAYSKGRSRSS